MNENSAYNKWGSDAEGFNGKRENLQKRKKDILNFWKMQLRL